MTDVTQKPHKHLETMSMTWKKNTKNDFPSPLTPYLGSARWGNDGAFYRACFRSLLLFARNKWIGRYADQAAGSAFAFRVEGDVNDSGVNDQESGPVGWVARARTSSRSKRPFQIRQINESDCDVKKNETGVGKYVRWTSKCNMDSLFRCFDFSIWSAFGFWTVKTALLVWELWNL